MLREANEHLDDHYQCRELGLSVEDLARIVARVLGIDVAEVWNLGHKVASVQARYLMCHWGREIGLTLTAVGKRFNLTESGASRAAQHGEELARQRSWRLKELKKR